MDQTWQRPAVVAMSLSRFAVVSMFLSICCCFNFLFSAIFGCCYQAFCGSTWVPRLWPGPRVLTSGSHDISWDPLTIVLLFYGYLVWAMCYFTVVHCDCWYVLVRWFCFLQHPDVIVWLLCCYMLLYVVIYMFFDGYIVLPMVFASSAIENKTHFQAQSRGIGLGWVLDKSTAK